ncbi:4-coumarate--CoA ligase-like 9 [Citrus sinensis]|uniref:4-coumarate--CoA ligase n=1 Tax=Citrus unshiu TaxID=55188 RepID=A0A2H5NVB1_CITUN|nr:4-coumarate--CoA ligase-like 9 [Citrus sinensis]KAH9708349.1 4-coumarate--CoA ligase-like 9 [Citrus sinensis]GAY44050.1 hypothetical protein CUMW_079280 [Citrus unshiu]
MPTAISTTPPNHPMAIINSLSMDPKNGFCSETKIFHSLRPSIAFPPETTSVTSYVFSLLESHAPPPDTTALIDTASRHRILYPDLTLRIKTLAYSLKTKYKLSKYDVAFLLSQNSVHVPVLYLSLFSLGVVVSPCNPSCTIPEILRQIHLSKPVIAFATHDTAHKIPQLKYGTVLVDSPEFESLSATDSLDYYDDEERVRVSVSLSDPAAILYSSGTTGMVKGALLTQRNLVAAVAGGHAVRAARSRPAVVLCTVPYFHSYGFTCCLRSLGMGESLVCMGKFDFGRVLKAVEEFRVSHVVLAPPVVLRMARDGGTMGGYDLSSIEVVASGGAHLTLSVIRKFKERLPKVNLAQGYGLTETTARIFGTVGPKECQVVGATGKLLSNCQAKIVDPESGIPQPPSTPGELWVRGPFIMKGYVGDEEATAAILDSDGWLRTGDLCYIDDEGFLFFVDRIKEMIKYNGYQIAPAELEHLLQSHPDIVDAAVVPFPDEQAGQIPIAFVVRKRWSIIDESQIQDFIAQQVAPYKRIRQVTFVDSLPKNAPGKVLRKELIKLAHSKATSKL